MKNDLARKVGMMISPLLFLGMSFSLESCGKVDKPEVIDFKGSQVYVSPSYIEGGMLEIAPDGNKIKYNFLPYVSMEKGKFYGKNAYTLLGIEVNGKDVTSDPYLWRPLKLRSDSILSEIDSIMKSRDEDTLKKIFR